MFFNCKAKKGNVVKWLIQASKICLKRLVLRLLTMMGITDIHLYLPVMNNCKPLNFFTKSQPTCQFAKHEN